MPPSSTGAVVIDANVLIAISSKEAIRDATATTELSRYATLGYLWFSPGAVIAETLYILCRKHGAGILSTAEYADSIKVFEATMRDVFPPETGDKTLIARAAEMNDSYGCSRSADGIYIALAEQLGLTTPTVLLTFDQDLPKQAARNAPSVNVQLLSS